VKGAGHSRPAPARPRNRGREWERRHLAPRARGMCL